MAQLILIGLLAFLFGIATHRGTICSVIAAAQLCRTGYASRLVGFLVGAACAFAVTVPIAWLNPDTVKLYADFGIVPAIVVGGAFYGLGALVNGACLFGTFSRLTAGDTTFLFTIPGIGLGSLVAQHLGLAGLRGPSASPLMSTPGALTATLYVAGLVFAIASAAAVLAALRRAGVGPMRLMRAKHWRPALSMVLIGATGGALFLLSDAWAPPALIKRIAALLAGGAPAFPLESLLGPAALFAGGGLAALFSGRLKVRPPKALAAVRALAGGTMMGTAAGAVPGGNDTMLLAAVPSLAVSGTLAYLAMFAVLVPAFFAYYRLGARSQEPESGSAAAGRG
ncbi:MAG: YeeE/YedE thiosulfate transporter family protein [Hyphomicrobiaceae bacterium]